MLVFEAEWSTTRGCGIELTREIRLAAVAVVVEWAALDGWKESVRERSREFGCSVAHYIKKRLKFESIVMPLFWIFSGLSFEFDRGRYFFTERCLTRGHVY